MTRQSSRLVHREAAGSGKQRQVQSIARGDARDIAIPGPNRHVRGLLHASHRQSGVIVLVHGSGVTRHDQGVGALAHHLGRSGFATLAVDLLDGGERADRHNVFDVELQAERLADVARWLDADRDTAHLPVGYFATGVGAAAVLLASAKRYTRAAAIVLYNGRPDVALYWLPRIATPTLFIVDARDVAAHALAVQACSRLAGERATANVTVWSPLTGEASAVETNRHALRWFERHLVEAQAPLALPLRSSRPRRVRRSFPRP